MAPRLELFAFRYRDPRTGQWIRARYRADRQEIAARYTEWEIIGPADIREVDPDARYFTPHAAIIEMPPDPKPTLESLEVFLLQLFLRRYSACCARRGKYAAMNGAALPYAHLRSAGA